MKDKEQRDLIEAALEVRRHAHAPYSEFHVGAALVTPGGRVFAGCNVENASFGLTLCAERNAVTRAVADGETTFASIAVATNGGHAPCGACRQVLAEFAPTLEVLLVDTSGEKATAVLTLSELLPYQFELPEEPAP